MARNDKRNYWSNDHFHIDPEAPRETTTDTPDTSKIQPQEITELNPEADALDHLNSWKPLSGCCIVMPRCSSA